MIKILKYLSTVIILMCFIFSSCSKSNDDEPTVESAKIIFRFSHFNEGIPQEFDKMKYINVAGNNYLVNEIQYFISDVKLHTTEGNYQLLDQWEDIHYVDTDIPTTHTWQIFDPVTPGMYKSISFTFGICEEKNQSLMFLNPPERDMFWPVYLGGGYHYMKLNGKWLAADEQVIPFDFHLGIGQIYINPDSIIGFIQNYYEVELPCSDFSAVAGDTLEFEIRMNIENWFKNPHVYNHDVWGGDIMQKQDAMKLGCDNGKQDVFSCNRLR